MMRALRALSFVLQVGVIALASPALAQYGTSGDTFAGPNQPNTVQGNGQFLNVTGSTASGNGNSIGGPSTITYLNFSSPFVPAGSSISKAQFVVYVDTVATAGSVDVYVLMSPWNEATLTYSTRPALGPVVVSGVPISKTGFVAFDVTSAYLAGLAGNGFAIVANASTPGLALSLDAKENVQTSHSPYLNAVLSSGLIPRGVWDPTVQYNLNDLITYLGSAYVATAKNTNQTPGIAAAWTLYVSKGDPGAQGLPGVPGPSGPPGPVPANAALTTQTNVFGPDQDFNGNVFVKAAVAGGSFADFAGSGGGIFFDATNKVVNINSGPGWNISLNPTPLALSTPSGILGVSGVKIGDVDIPNGNLDVEGNARVSASNGNKTLTVESNLNGVPGPSIVAGNGTILVTDAGGHPSSVVTTAAKGSTITLKNPTGGFVSVPSLVWFDPTAGVNLNGVGQQIGTVIDASQTSLDVELSQSVTMTPDPSTGEPSILSVGTPVTNTTALSPGGVQGSGGITATPGNNSVTIGAQPIIINLGAGLGGSSQIGLGGTFSLNNTLTVNGVPSVGGNIPLTVGNIPGALPSGAPVTDGSGNAGTFAPSGTTLSDALGNTLTLTGSQLSINSPTTGLTTARAGTLQLTPTNGNRTSVGAAGITVAPPAVGSSTAVTTVGAGTLTLGSGNPSIGDLSIALGATGDILFNSSVSSSTLAALTKSGVIATKGTAVVRNIATGATVTNGMLLSQNTDGTVVPYNGGTPFGFAGEVFSSDGTVYAVTGPASGQQVLINPATPTVPGTQYDLTAGPNGTFNALPFNTAGPAKLGTYDGGSGLATLNGFAGGAGVTGVGASAPLSVSGLSNSPTINLTGIVPAANLPDLSSTYVTTGTDQNIGGNKSFLNFVSVPSLGVGTGIVLQNTAGSLTVSGGPINANLNGNAASATTAATATTSNNTFAIGGNAVATGTTPANGQVLGWNGASSTWGPQSLPSAPSFQTFNFLVPGPATITFNVANVTNAPVPDCPIGQVCQLFATVRLFVSSSSPTGNPAVTLSLAFDGTPTGDSGTITIPGVSTHEISLTTIATYSGANHRLTATASTPSSLVLVINNGSGGAGMVNGR